MEDFLVILIVSLQVTNMIILSCCMFKTQKNKEKLGSFTDTVDYIDEANNKLLQMDTWRKVMASKKPCASKFRFVNKLISRKLIPFKHHQLTLIMSTVTDSSFLELIEFDKEKSNTIQENAVEYIEGEVEVIVFEILFALGLLAQIILLMFTAL